jgi:hypothetical protein
MQDATKADGAQSATGCRMAPYVPDTSEAARGARPGGSVDCRTRLDDHSRGLAGRKRVTSG